MAESSDLTPIEWLGRLGPKLLERRLQIDRWRRYYEGDQDLPQGPSQHREAFKNFQKTARTNLCLLCAESMVHRTKVTGFRETAGEQSDDAVWKLWQAAKLDARQFGIWRKAYSRSVAYVTVGVDPRKPRTPRVTIEGPENVIVEPDPADASYRPAALRLWHDSIAKRWMATLYLPGTRYHWQSRKEYVRDRPLDGGQQPLAFTEAQWELRTDPARSLPEVPVVPFMAGDEGEVPRAVFDSGIDVQDRLNLTLLNRLSAERYASFRQRGLLNFEPETDPVTGVTIARSHPVCTSSGRCPRRSRVTRQAVRLRSDRHLADVARRRGRHAGLRGGHLDPGVLPARRPGEHRRRLDHCAGRRARGEDPPASCGLRRGRGRGPAADGRRRRARPRPDQLRDGVGAPGGLQPGRGRGLHVQARRGADSAADGGRGGRLVPAAGICPARRVGRSQQFQALLVAPAAPEQPGPANEAQPGARAPGNQPRPSAPSNQPRPAPSPAERPPQRP